MGFAPSLTGANDGVVYYAYSIQLNGKEIGTIQSFSPSSTRNAERLREIRASTGTKTVALVPGREDRELTLQKVTLFKKSVLGYFGENEVPDPVTIFNIIRNGVDIVEQLYQPPAEGEGNTAPSTLLDTTTYKHCVPSQYSKAIELGNVFVMENVTVVCGDVV